MKKFFVTLMCFFSAVVFLIPAAQSEEKDMSTYENVHKNAQVKLGVREITYEQFLAIRASGEKYALFDVLPEDSYKSGHIEGSLSFPVNTITEAEAENRVSKDANIIVYCGSFACQASTSAARKLNELGYKALDYKGGLDEWQEKGNSLVK